ncbi:MAG: type II toxin-antitoxin system YafQ family toxin [Alistipes sp.]|jgi:mRNA interferase YafQ|nr:type II toxin-antitoxin system YafQ family toxin [Alistipes sp.]
MLEIDFTRLYLKDLKRIVRRNLPRHELDEVVGMLAEEQTLSPKFKDHALKGNWTGYRECHIRPDWLLVYRVERRVLTLVLVRTGTHSDIFG